jgi:hypothetical protein
VTTPANPLVAPVAEESPSPWAGVWIVEDIEQIAAGVRDRSRVEGTLRVAGGGLDAPALESDPAGALLQYGIAWLLELEERHRRCGAKRFFADLSSRVSSPIALLDGVRDPPWGVQPRHRPRLVATWHHAGGRASRLVEALPPEPIMIIRPDARGCCHVSLRR